MGGWYPDDGSASQHALVLRTPHRSTPPPPLPRDVSRPRELRRPLHAQIVTTRVGSWATSISGAEILLPFQLSRENTPSIPSKTRSCPCQSSVNSFVASPLMVSPEPEVLLRMTYPLPPLTIIDTCVVLMGAPQLSV